MRARGIHYDTGFINKGVSSREPFDLDILRRELQIIHDDLHCTAVRITGGGTLVHRGKEYPFNRIEPLDSAVGLAAFPASSG